MIMNKLNEIVENQVIESPQELENAANANGIVYTTMSVTNEPEWHEDEQVEYLNKLVENHKWGCVSPFKSTIDGKDYFFFSPGRGFLRAGGIPATKENLELMAKYLSETTEPIHFRPVEEQMKEPDFYWPENVAEEIFYKFAANNCQMAITTFPDKPEFLSCYLRHSRRGATRLWIRRNELIDHIARDQYGIELPELPKPEDSEEDVYVPGSMFTI